MFIRKVTHTHPKTGEKYHTHKLVESVRTERGPRQRMVLNLGTDFSLPPEEWKELADRIEAVIVKQLPLFPVPKHIESMARKYADKVIRRHGKASEEKETDSSESEEPGSPEPEPDYQTVDINTIENEKIRTVGGEHVVLETIRELELEKLFEDLGFNRPNIDTTIGVIVARLLAPSSERAAHIWLQDHTALGDLLGADFTGLSQDRVYRVSDQLLKNKVQIETHLHFREKTLFNLEERIILYDLTNTFFEGSGAYNGKAHFGHSKEKRTDCPLVTLGLVLDSDGFPKRSQTFDGNVGEAKTLKEMIQQLSTSDKHPLIVMDAGIATEKNIEWLKSEGRHYLVVSRKRKKEIPSDLEMITVRQDSQRTVRACIVRSEGDCEIKVYCHSSAKEIKEQGIKTRFERRFEDELIKVQNGLSQKHGTKKYPKVLERIGRLKERRRKVAGRYEISVEKDEKTGNAINMKWYMKDKDAANGYYVLRTNRTDLNEKEIFDIFTQLLDIESAFRSMKSELGLRPVYHQTERRTDGHLFITVLAYHVLHAIRFKLKARGITDSWNTIRGALSTQFRVTTSVKRSDGKIIYIRKTSSPEPAHIKIYEALGLPRRPGQTTKTIL